MASTDSFKKAKNPPLTAKRVALLASYITLISTTSIALSRAEESPDISQKLVKEQNRINALSDLDFCSKELRKLKGRKNPLPQPWFDAIRIRSTRMNVPGNHLLNIQDGGVVVGMNTCSALAAWGRPKDVNRTTNKYGTTEQWVYGDRNYLYFDNDTLRSVQN